MIPLTTTFTPPPDCLASLTVSAGDLLLGADTSCRPSGAGKYYNTQFFSPGLICPSGWTSVTATTVTVGSATETRATCCPSLGHISFSGETRMYAAASLGFGCTAWIYGPITALVLTGSTNYPTTILGYTGPTYATVRAEIVQIAYQASDLRSSSASSSAPPTSAASSPAPTGFDSPSGLSTAAKVSMGVAIPVVVFAALALGFFIIRRRKTKTKSPRREIQQEMIQEGLISPIESTTKYK